MGIKVTWRKGSTAEHNTFAGDAGEVTVEHPVDSNGDPVAGDTTNSPWRLRVHDGSTQGGHIIATRDGVDTLSNKTLASPKFSGNVQDTNNNTVLTLDGSGNVTIPSIKTNNAAGTSVSIGDDYRNRAIKMSLAIGGDF